MLPTTMPPALATGLVPDLTLMAGLQVAGTASPFASVLQASLEPAQTPPAPLSLPLPAGAPAQAMPSPAMLPPSPELATPALSLPIRAMTAGAPLPADPLTPADAAPAQPAAPAAGGSVAAPESAPRKPAAAPAARPAADPCQQPVEAAPELPATAEAAPSKQVALPEVDETVQEQADEPTAAPVTPAVVPVVPPAAAIVLPTMTPAILAVRPELEGTQAPVAAAEPRGRAVKGEVPAMPALLRPAGADGEPRQPDEAANQASSATAAVPPLAADAGPTPATAESVVAADVRGEPSSPLGRELPAPVPARTAPVADTPPAGASSFAPKLQAAVTFAGHAERVTARLFAHKDEGGSRLTIELDPMELGSVAVDLRLDDRGTASATFTVERPETLQLLQRDTRALVDLLAGAGFSVDAGGLGFELRQEQQQARQQHQSPTGHLPRGHAEGEGRPGGGPAPPPPGRGLLDLRV